MKWLPVKKCILALFLAAFAASGVHADPEAIQETTGTAKSAEVTETTGPVKPAEVLGTPEVTDTTGSPKITEPTPPLVTPRAQEPTEPVDPSEPIHSPFYYAGVQRLSVAGGLAIPTGANDLSKSEKTGPAGGVQYLYQWDDFWAVGIQADFFRLNAKEHATTSLAGGGATERSRDTAALLEAMFRYNIAPTARFVPYVHSGVGLNYFHQTVEGEPLPGSTWYDTSTTEMRTLQNVETVKFSCSVGLGVETALSHRLILGLESTWHLLGVSRSALGTPFLNVPTVFLRLGWRFGAE